MSTPSSGTPGSLGFMELMSLAERNSKMKQKELERMELLKQKGKKVDPKQAQLNVGVQRFLAKREEEGRRKREEEERKKQRLLQLRNQDKKATNRVKRMLNQTKSAHKGVIEEAKESWNQGQALDEQQPDEDDYGYTSEYSNQLYKKMMEGYKLQAEREDKEKDVLARLDKRRKGRVGGGCKKGDESQPFPTQEDNKESIGKKKKPPPPPLPSFNELLRLAEEKSKEPVALTKPEKESVEDTFEFGRPMTNKEKKAYLQELELKKRAAIFAEKGAIEKDSMKNGNAVKSKEQPKIKLSFSSSTPIPPVVVPRKQTARLPVHSHPRVPTTSIPNGRPPQQRAKKVETNEHEHATQAQASKFASSSQRSSMKDMSTSRTQVENLRKSAPTSTTVKPQYEAKLKDEKRVKFSLSHTSNTPLRSQTNEKAQKQPQSSSSSSQQTPVKDKGVRTKPLANESRDISRPKPRFSLNPYLNRDIPMSRFHRMGGMTGQNDKRKGRARVESDDEYDPDMDDFIDDTDAGVPPEISDLIGSMFRYNKRKHINDYDDDECMESNFDEQIREEARSARLGLIEDLEDMKMEEEEKRRKTLMKKKLKR